jgi:aspartate-semialdehyde dehydrogenase
VSAIAIVHPTNLLGKELTETLENRGPRWTDIRLLSTREDEIGNLTEVAGAAALVQRYEPDSLDGIRVAFFCGPVEHNRPVLEKLPPETTAVVLSPDADASDGVPVVAGVNTPAACSGGVLLSPHPAVVLLAHLLHPLRELAPESAVATLIQPASMRDDPGIEELFEQTRQIVAMIQRRPTPVFGAQLSFNLLPTPLPADPVAAQLHAVLGGPPPVSLQILQGGIFHSLSASVYVRLGGNPGLQAVRRALGEHLYLEVADKPRHLGPIDAAASEKVIFGTVRRDEAGGFWLWAVMDNLTRGGVLNAVEIAEAAAP